MGGGRCNGEEGGGYDRGLKNALTVGRCGVVAYI